MKNYEKCQLHHCFDKTERIVNHLEYQLHGETCCNDTGERGASATRTQADHSRRESLMSSSPQEPRAYGKPE